MPVLAHFFNMQPSEARGLKMRELRAFSRYKEEYDKAMREAS